jgi:HSP20 family molecular chaperone IbpA
MNSMSRLASPLLLGFEDLEQIVDTISRNTSDGYPPYNIEKIPSGEGVILRITIALAGFSEDDLDISVEGRQLRVEGRQINDGDRDFLHRGIAARQFRKQFLLADGIEVAGAELGNGLLSIELVKPTSQAVTRRIEIGKSKRNVRQSV